METNQNAIFPTYSGIQSFQTYHPKPLDKKGRVTDLMSYATLSYATAR